MKSGNVSLEESEIANSIMYQYFFGVSAEEAMKKEELRCQLELKTVGEIIGKTINRGNPSITKKKMFLG